VTISSLATAGGTLVLAVATFSSVRSANRSARVAERSLLAGLRPVLIPSRDDDRGQTVRFGDAHMLEVQGHAGAVDAANGSLYLGVGLRNGGTGLAVIHGWGVLLFEGADSGPPSVDQFRRQQRDLYIPADETGFWQGAIRERSDPGYETVRHCVEDGARLGIDVLYGDYEGGQRTIARFGLSTRIDSEGRPIHANGREPTSASDGEGARPTEGAPASPSGDEPVNRGDEPVSSPDQEPASPGQEPASPSPTLAHDGHYAFRAEVVRYFNVDLEDPR
jgi:hypothetical protein